VVACLEGQRRSERDQGRDTPEFQAVAALEQRVDEARATVLARLSLLDLLRERDSLRQDQPMFFI